jgi:MFS family permease
VSGRNPVFAAREPQNAAQYPNPWIQKHQTNINPKSIAFIGSSFAYELWHLVLSQGVCFGIGMGLIFCASAPVPPQWFTKKRSLANGLCAAGSGFGGLLYSLAANAMIESIGLAWTFRALAIICFVVNGIACLFVRDRNLAVGSVHIAFNWSLFRRPSFILLQIWLVLSIIGYTILVFSIVAYCQAVGLSASQASLVGALFNRKFELDPPWIDPHEAR